MWSAYDKDLRVELVGTLSFDLLESRRALARLSGRIVDTKATIVNNVSS